MLITIPSGTSIQKEFISGTFYKIKYYQDNTRTSAIEKNLQYISYDILDKGTVDEKPCLFCLDWTDTTPPAQILIPTADLIWVNDNVDLNLAEIIYTESGVGEHHLNFE